MLHMLMIDALELQALSSFQTSLQQVSTLLALQSQQLPDSQLGLCAIHYATTKGVQLQVLRCMFV